jgi:uncharacterized membrane protein
VAAYVAGTFGTLIGADVMNLGKLRGLGPVASIGGAGTFDGTSWPASSLYFWLER